MNPSLIGPEYRLTLGYVQFTQLQKSNIIYKKVALVDYVQQYIKCYYPGFSKDPHPLWTMSKQKQILDLS